LKVLNVLNTIFIELYSVLLDLIQKIKQMSSDKRDLSDLLNYEGSIIKKKNTYEFPQLFNVSKNGKIRVWKISIRLIKDPDYVKNKFRNKKIDWNMLNDDQLPIKIGYISGDKKLPPCSVAQYWVVTGEITGKKTRHPPSYGELKNKDRENERNSLQTAIITSRNEYLKKIKQGFGKDIKNITSRNKKYRKNIRYFPMLPVKYKERYEKIEYPCYVQPKLDGTRTVAFLSSTSNQSGKKYEVVLYTRELKDVPGKKNIIKQLLPILQRLYDHDRCESIYIDFEFYGFGKKLQDISAEFRRDDYHKSSNSKNSAQCWIFDAFYPSCLQSVGFDERIEWIDEIFEREKITNTIQFAINKNEIIKNYCEWLTKLKKEIKFNNIEQKEEDVDKKMKKLFKKEKGVPSLKFAQELMKKLKNMKINKHINFLKIPIYNNIVKVPTFMARNRVEEEYIYRAMLTLGFEGSIVRNMDGIYKADPNTKSSYLRSMDVQKRKVQFSEEYPIENYTQGKKGREKGALIWVLIRHKCRSDNLKSATYTKDKLFNAAPKNVTIKERKQLFELFEKNKSLFDKEYKGKLITVEYEDLSNDGIPQRLKALGLRPYK